MINHVLPRMACSWAILVIALAHCGCQSMKGPSGWMAWNSKPKPSKPNDKEIVTYWGQKKDKNKPDVNVLKERMAQANRDAAQKPSFDNLLRQGNQALVSNRLLEAQEAYEKALALQPDNPDCHHRLAVVADKNHQFGLADDHYQAALKQRPRDPNLLSDMGYSFSLRGDDRRAEATLQQALEISPSHKGAMANMGAIYVKQDRYEDALAMFRRGGSEFEAQQYLAKLFPQRGGPGTGIDPQAVAQNSNTRPTIPNEERVDTRGMTPEQLREAMQRGRAESIRRRQEQMRDEMKPPPREWHDLGTQTAQITPSNQPPIMIGPGTNSMPNTATPNNLPVVTPKGGNPANGFSNQGFAPGGNAPSSNDSLLAQRGTTPNIDAWSGAGVRDEQIQRVGGGQSNFDRPPVTTADASGNSPGQFGQQRPLNGVNLQPSVGPGRGNLDINANRAAAQLGMNVGPGGLFPVMPDEGSNQSSFGQQGQTPTMDTKFGAEFPTAPSYQNPNRSSFGSDQRQGSLDSPWGFQSGRRNPGNVNENESLAPSSPGSGWGQPGGQVIQAGATSPADPSVPRFSNDPNLDRSSSQNSTWADKPNLNGAAPFNGSWPPGSQSANPIRANTDTPNSLPMWNGGQSATRPQPKQLGSASSAHSGYYPEQWQGTPR